MSGGFPCFYFISGDESGSHAFQRDVTEGEYHGTFLCAYLPTIMFLLSISWMWAAYISNGVYNSISVSYALNEVLDVILEDAVWSIP